MPIAIAALLLAAASPPAGPQAVVEGVYALYRNPDFNTFDHAERYFTPKLAKAMNDDATMDPGEVGFLDYDPLCQCQDDSGMKTKVRSETQKGNTADVRVAVYFGTRDQRDIRLKLERTPAGWRIADIATKDDPSLLAELIKSNRDRRAEKHKR
jgi:hypothetical protein